MQSISSNNWRLCSGEDRSSWSNRAINWIFFNSWSTSTLSRRTAWHTMAQNVTRRFRAGAARECVAYFKPTIIWHVNKWQLAVNATDVRRDHTRAFDLSIFVTVAANQMRTRARSRIWGKSKPYIYCKSHQDMRKSRSTCDRRSSCYTETCEVRWCRIKEKQICDVKDRANRCVQIPSIWLIWHHEVASLTHIKRRSRLRVLESINPYMSEISTLSTWKELSPMTSTSSIHVGIINRFEVLLIFATLVEDYHLCTSFVHWTAML